MPVRLGAPYNVTGMVEVVRNPIHATGVGLLHYGMQQQKEGHGQQYVPSTTESIWDRMKSWFKEF
jgi:cell division protein FtsA